MRHRPIVVAVCLTALGCPIIVRAQPAAAPSYIDIVAQYRAGAFAAAVAALRKLDAAAIDSGVNALVRSAETTKTIEPLQRASLLHTEALIDPDRPGWHRLSPDLAIARRLMELVEERDKHSAFVRQWRLLLTAFLQGHQDLRLAMDYARGTWKPMRVRTRPAFMGVEPATKADSTLPEGLQGDDDAELRLAIAVIHEQAWVLAQGSAPDLARGDLAIAERELRRSLAMRPDVEARIRLGRVLALQGKYDNASKAIAEVPDTIEPAFKFLVKLFEGDLAERRGDAARAERCYTAAGEAMPSALSARIALAHLRHAAGNRADAAARVQDALMAVPGAGGVPDPWVRYQRGLAWRTDAYLSRLRDMIQPGGTR